MQSEDISRGSQCRNYCRAVTTFCFSHIGLCSLVFGYCIMGAFTFKQLELKNEMKNRDDVERRRNNAADELLNFNKDLLVYHTSNWTQTVTRVLNKLESDLVHAMKIEGYDGIDGGEPQWSFSGALFYSIIVITTIGYGNVAPKTTWGKIVTILYAIVGVPLMLLCLSNIGDAMAQSFKFLYWRVCCFLCGGPPKKRHQRTRSFRQNTLHRYPSMRSRPGSFKRQYSFKDSSQGGDSLSRSSYYSAPNPNTDDMKFYDQEANYNRRTASTPVSPNSHGFANQVPPSQLYPPDQGRGGRDPGPIIFNKYAMKQGDDLVVDLEHIDRKRGGSTRSWHNSSDKRKQQGPQKVVEEIVSADIAEEEYEGDSANTMDGDESGSSEVYVPTWLCLFTVFLYICGGGALFKFWENWDFLDSTYFCFVTLTTIGFGDLVPGKAVKSDANLTLGLCSLYLWFGMALLAMSFNLVKGEVTKSVKSVGVRIGILPEGADDEE